MRGRKECLTAQRSIHREGDEKMRRTINETIGESINDVALSQKEFCERTHISPDWCRKLRLAGYIPFFGKKKVYIPYKQGVEGYERYARDFAEGKVD